MGIQQIENVVGEPVIGRFYLVPCVRGMDWRGMFRRGNWFGARSERGIQ